MPLRSVVWTFLGNAPLFFFFFFLFDLYFGRMVSLCKCACDAKEVEATILVENLPARPPSAQGCHSAVDFSCFGFEAVKRHPQYPIMRQWDTQL